MKQDVKKKFEEFYSENSQFRNTWRDIAKYFWPKKVGLFDKRTKGQYNYNELFTSVPEECVKVYTAGMTNGLTSPNVEWFDLGIRSLGNGFNKDVGDWLSNARDVAHTVLAGSRFYSVIEGSHIDDCLFGNSCVYMEYGDDGLVFENVPVTTIAFWTDIRQRVYEAIRKFSMTPMQYKQQYGSLPPNTSKDEKKDIDVYHRVWKNENYKTDKPMAGKNWPFLSETVCNDKVVDEGGYPAMPYIITRITPEYGEEFGRGLGETALGDARSLNQAAKDGLYAASKVARPPVMLSGSSDIDEIDLGPDGVTFFDPTTDLGANVIQPVPTFDNPQLLLTKEADLAQRVRVQMLTPVFQTITVTAMEQGTATGMQLAKSEQLQMITNAVTANTEQKLSAIINQLLTHMLLKGVIKPLEVEGVDGELDIAYNGSLMRSVRAQSKLEAINAELSYVGTVTQLTQDASILDFFNAEEGLKITADAFSGGSLLLRSDEDVQAIREQRQAMEQAQMAMQAAQAQPAQ